MVDCLFTSMPLLIFCLVVLSIADSGVLKFPAVVVDLSASPLSSINFHLIFKKIFFVCCVQIQDYIFLRK